MTLENASQAVLQAVADLSDVREVELTSETSLVGLDLDELDEAELALGIMAHLDGDPPRLLDEKGFLEGFETCGDLAEYLTNGHREGGV